MENIKAKADKLRDFIANIDYYESRPLHSCYNVDEKDITIGEIFSVERKTPVIDLYPHIKPETFWKAKYENEYIHVKENGCDDYYDDEDEDRYLPVYKTYFDGGGVVQLPYCSITYDELDKCYDQITEDEYYSALEKVKAIYNKELTPNEKLIPSIPLSRVKPIKYGTLYHNKYTSDFTLSEYREIMNAIYVADKAKVAEFVDRLNEEYSGKCLSVTNGVGNIIGELISFEYYPEKLYVVMNFGKCIEKLPSKYSLLESYNDASLSIDSRKVISNENHNYRIDGLYDKDKFENYYKEMSSDFEKLSNGEKY